MSIIVEILIVLCLIGNNLFEILRINLFRIAKNALLVGLTSMISIGFGLYLFIKNGLILDYGSENEISSNWAGQMWILGVLCMLIGLGSILSSIVKYVICKFKKNAP